MARASLFAAMMAICGWISIPAPPYRFTLQSFAISLCLMTLGGKWGGRSVLIYLALGAAGLPVFSGFRGGAGALMDVTGGFLWGFLAMALVYRVMETKGKLPALILGQLSCYACGLLWFTGFTGERALLPAAAVTVLPYLVPDALKIWLAHTAAKRLERHVR